MEMTAIYHNHGGGGGRRGRGRSPTGDPGHQQVNSFNGCGRAGSTILNGAALDIDFAPSPASIKRLGRVYPQDDVTRALATSKNLRVQWFATTPGRPDHMWSVFLVLTSDAAWGSTRTCMAGEMMKAGARAFMCDLLLHTCGNSVLLEDYSVVHFLLAYLHRMHHPAFTRVLRGVIIAFPHTLEWLSASRDLAGERLTALQLAVERDCVPLSVLKVLLEARADVEHATGNGETPLLLACYTGPEGGKDGKAELLVDYGARIDAYNLQMQNALHMAAESENAAGMRMLLGVRAQLVSRAGVRNVAAGAPVVRAEHVRRNCAALDPDPLHLPDMQNMTPLTTVCLNECMHHKDRAAMATLLVDAGADADEDVDLQTRMAAQACDVPLAYGVMSCTTNADNESTLTATVRTASQSFEVEASVGVLVFFVDAAESVLPGPECPFFSLETLFVSCKNQRFCFRPDLGGMDFDVHFDAARCFSGFKPLFGKSPGHKTQFVACVRMPRGPCELSVWTDGFMHGNVFIDRGYTLAHRAAVCADSDTRMRVTHMARSLCNPLKRCREGLTAAGTLARVVGAQEAATDAAQRSEQWGLARLLKSMRKRERTMQEYVHCDALLLADGAVGTASEQVQAVALRDKKRPRRAAGTATGTSAADTATTTAAPTKPAFVSPFSVLPDDVCMRIIGLV